jgi:predicted amidohydrolase YtcJ
MHATYGETITRILDIFERVFKETSYRGRWVIDHAETIKMGDIGRIKAMGGGLAIQNRLAFLGEMFAERETRLLNEASCIPPIVFPVTIQ